MTREEAIFELQHHRVSLEKVVCAKDFTDALEMAIEALSAIEDIRAEIAEYKDDKIIHLERNEMVDNALKIIDRHINGKEIND